MSQTNMTFPGEIGVAKLQIGRDRTGGEMCSSRNHVAFSSIFKDLDDDLMQEAILKD